jgi:hypothetical protein
LSIKTIMRELGLAEETVRRFCRADPVDDLLAKRRAGQPSILDAFKPFPHQAWNDGCHNVLDLRRQVTTLGYRGTYSQVRDYLAPYRACGAEPPTYVEVPKVRRITSWMTRSPENLTGRHGERIDAWLHAVEASDLPHLHRFARGAATTTPSATA